MLASKVKGHLGGPSGNLKDKIVGVWGLAFKPETDDIRESPAIVTIEDVAAG